MTTVTKKANKHVSKIVNDRVRELYLAGNFPEVNYREERGMTGYNLFEHVSVVNATLRITHERLMKMGFTHGACEAKRSDQFLAIVTSVVNAILVEDISAGAKSKPFSF